MRFFFDAPEATNLIVLHKLSVADIALLMIMSCFEISVPPFLLFRQKTGLHAGRPKHNIITLKHS